CSSLPSQNVNPAVAFIPGASLESRMSSCARLYGFCGVTSGAKIAASNMTESATSAATAIRSRAKPAENCPRGVSANCIWMTPMNADERREHQNGNQCSPRCYGALPSAAIDGLLLTCQSCLADQIGVHRRLAASI